eukprot:TRINITY_DN30341_c0_g1_i1.p1 TRINITY_DN30341_c0_g1~~TRINITY_DN30341_c0_g1_i1.p1  ORF type:complete len:585 (-),score=53.05 TRINITY_DN30341_c0_g1_i1:31-1785(-)
MPLHLFVTRQPEPLGTCDIILSVKSRPLHYFVLWTLTHLIWTAVQLRTPDNWTGFLGGSLLSLLAIASTSTSLRNQNGLQFQTLSVCTVLYADVFWSALGALPPTWWLPVVLLAGRHFLAPIREERKATLFLLGALVLSVPVGAILSALLRQHVPREWFSECAAFLHFTLCPVLVLCRELYESLPSGGEALSVVPDPSGHVPLLTLPTQYPSYAPSSPPATPASQLNTSESRNSLKSRAQAKYHATGQIRYKIAGLLGKGGFAEVFLGMNSETGELIAVKQLAQGGTPDQQAALEREIDLLKKLRHPRIVTYLGSDRRSESFRVLLEYVPGGSLGSLLAQFGPFRETVLRLYTQQILEGLAYLHSQDVVHGDVKCDNVLMCVNGDVKLTDFGASSWRSGLASADAPTGPSGTVLWMAPEVCKGSRPQFSSDIWSLACTCIEMATAGLPWEELHFDNQIAAFYHIAMATGPPKIPERLSPAAHGFLASCFALQPAERPLCSALLNHSWFTSTQQDPRTHTTQGAQHPTFVLQRTTIDGDAAELERHLTFVNETCSVNIAHLRAPDSALQQTAVNSLLGNIVAEDG